MLGVYIVRYQGGIREFYGSDYKWKEVILDLRNDLAKLSNHPDIKEFYPVITSDLGICVGVIRMLSGSRPDDHLEAWLFIPKGVSIPGKELYNKLKKLKGMIQESQIDEGKCTEIENWKGGNNIATNILISKQKSDSKAYFRVETTDFNMMEVLDKLYQESYFYYKVVYLLEMRDRDCRFPVDWDMENISEKFVEKTNNLRIPQIPVGIEVIIGESILSTKNKTGNYCIPSNINEARVIRDGFKDIFITKLSDFENDHFFADLRWKKIIKRDFFTILGANKNNREISCFNLCVDDKELDSEICLFEKELSKVSVVVEANGYKKFEEVVDLGDCSSESPFIIELEKEEETYDLVIPYFVKNEKTKISYTISIEDWRECRVEGYKNKKCGNEIRFEYDSRYWIRSKGKFILMILFLVLLLGGGIGISVGSLIAKNSISEMVNKYNDSIVILRNENDSLEKIIGKETPEKEVCQQVEDSTHIKVAITYLNGNDVLKKDTMEKIEYIKGLWDDLNSRNRTVIIKNWNHKLVRGYTKWEKITTAFLGLDPQFEPKIFTKSNSIDINKYIKSFLPSETEAKKDKVEKGTGNGKIQGPVK